MAEGKPDLDDLLAQWRVLPAGDRKAIRKRLPMKRRILLDQALASSRSGGGAEAAAGVRREYANYSPWLAEIVSACEAGDAINCSFKPAVRDAIQTAHSAVSAQMAEPARPSLFDVVRMAVRQFGVRS